MRLVYLFSMNSFTNTHPPSPKKVLTIKTHSPAPILSQSFNLSIISVLIKTKRQHIQVSSFFKTTTFSDLYQILVITRKPCVLIFIFLQALHTKKPAWENMNSLLHALYKCDVGVCIILLWASLCLLFSF